MFFFFNDTATTEIYTLSLHDALPIFDPVTIRLPSGLHAATPTGPPWPSSTTGVPVRSEEHTSELQSPCNLVCRLLLEKKSNSTCLSDIQSTRKTEHHTAHQRRSARHL